MKSIMKMATIFIVLFSMTSVFASTGNPDFNIKNAGEKTLYFDSKNMSSSFVEVTFQDENGKTLFSEYAIHTATFERKYNLSELANGAYFLIVKSETETKMLPIIITKDGLKIDLEHLEVF